MTAPQRSRSSLLEIEAGIGHRLHAGGDAVVHELIHAPRFLGRQVLREVEAAHRAAEAHREGGDVEARDRTDAALAAQNRRPRRIGTVLPTGETMPRPVTTTRRLLTRYLYEG